MTEQPVIHPGQTVIPLPDDAARMNRTGSPTGRVFREAPQSSVRAAKRTRALSMREKIYRLLMVRPGSGATSVEIAEWFPESVKVSNRAASRLGELWEEQRAAVERERGVCSLGVCRPHSKPVAVHKPTAPCDVHGSPRTRGGAAIWRAL